MTLLQKINMCLALWNPEMNLHQESANLLSYWYNQTRYPAEHQYLSYDKFRSEFSLPNSSYIPIPICIMQDSKEA